MLASLELTVVGGYENVGRVFLWLPTIIKILFSALYVEAKCRTVILASVSYRAKEKEKTRGSYLTVVRPW